MNGAAPTPRLQNITVNQPSLVSLDSRMTRFQCKSQQLYPGAGLGSPVVFEGCAEVCKHPVQADFRAASSTRDDSSFASI